MLGRRSRPPQPPPPPPPPPTAPVQLHKARPPIAPTDRRPAWPGCRRESCWGRPSELPGPLIDRAPIGRLLHPIDALGPQPPRPTPNPAPIAGPRRARVPEQTGDLHPTHCCRPARALAATSGRNRPALQCKPERSSGRMEWAKRWASRAHPICAANNVLIPRLGQPSGGAEQHTEEESWSGRAGMAASTN